MVESKFLKVQCPRCANLQITYGKASMRIKCSRCNKLLIKPRGGKAKIKAAIIKIIWTSKKTT